MKYKKGDWVYIDYNGVRPPFPYKIIEINECELIKISVYKRYKDITGWGDITNSWAIDRSDIIKKVGLELE